MIAKHKSYHITKLHFWINILLTVLGSGLAVVWTIIFSKFKELEILKTNSFIELFNFVTNLDESNIEKIQENTTELIILFFVFAGLFCSIVSFYLFNVVVSVIMIFKVVFQQQKTLKIWGIVAAICGILCFLIVASILDLVYLIYLKKDNLKVSKNEFSSSVE